MHSKGFLVATALILSVSAIPAFHPGKTGADAVVGGVDLLTAADLDARSADASPTITLCTAGLTTGACYQLPVVSDQCVSLTGGLTILNKEISSAIIPNGFLCTLFASFGCATANAANSHDEIGLVGGSYPNFFVLTGISGTQDFNDMTSSFSCSPLTN
ncbi:hypothetical protein VKT23_019142 [Stygiomarasmius scandens]|uniref:Uncharacterized protein n=1 Tax=Marasmiellus scandens TaxID=2682957 RepID=A0ABR1IM61_9AGAR